MSVKTHKEGEGMTSYIEDSYSRIINKTEIKIINFTPIYNVEEEHKIKREIEKQLYEIFCKYVSH